VNDSDGFTRRLEDVDAALTQVEAERRAAVLSAERCEAEARHNLAMALAYRKTAAMRATYRDALLEERHRARLDREAAALHPELLATIDDLGTQPA
jgi:hypothetical protein